MASTELAAQHRSPYTSEALSQEMSSVPPEMDTSGSAMSQYSVRLSDSSFDTEMPDVITDFMRTDENSVAQESNLYSILPFDDDMLPWFEGLDVKNTDDCLDLSSFAVDPVTVDCLESPVSSSTAHADDVMERKQSHESSEELHPGSNDCDSCTNCSTDLSEFFVDSGLLKVTVADGLESQLPSTSAHTGNISGRKRRHESPEELHSLTSDLDRYIKTRSARVSSTASDTDSEICSSSEAGDRHVIRRLKNNTASRRSRQTTKQKHVNMEKKAKELEQVNAELKERIKQLEEVLHEMEEEVIKVIAKK